jgi:hypothetical protein
MTELKFERTRLQSLYIDKRIDSNTLKNVLDASHQTVYRLYLISNGIKELQDFARVSSKEYSLSAYVKTECGFAGDARSQVWAITHIQPLLKKKPLYKLKCELRHLESNKIVYKCSLEDKNEDVIYNQIQECINDINKII